MEKLKEFMRNRYGLDQLSVALVLLGCLITFVLSFLRTPYYRLFGLLPMLLALWRVLSKQTEKRFQENERFLRFWTPIRQKCGVWIAHLRDRDHRYYHCPTCKRVLRVPKNRGRIEISCPHCGTKFKKRT